MNSENKLVYKFKQLIIIKKTKKDYILTIFIIISTILMFQSLTSFLVDIFKRSAHEKIK